MPVQLSGLDGISYEVGDVLTLKVNGSEESIRLQA